MRRRKGNAGGQNMGGLFTFALVGIFAILALLVAVVGVQAYQSVLDTTERNNEVRASMSYFINKVRAGDGMNSVRVGEFDGHCALLIDHNYDGDEYQTRIFYRDGALYEQLASMEDEFDPEDGEYLIAVSDFTVEYVAPGLLFLSVISRDGEAHSAHVAVKTYEWGRG